MTTRNAHASVLLINFIERGGSESISGSDITSASEAIPLDSEILSISTTKQKGAPAGSFEFTLAPTKNWVSSITPGSWVLIHMAPRMIDKKDIASSSKETLKMIGRIDSVRVAVSVDSTGTRNTIYRVQGRDWGQFFESSLYIDPVASFSSDSAISQANKIGLDILTEINKNKKETNASTSSLIEFILKLFAGQGLDNLRKSNSDAFSKGADQLLPKYVYQVPKQLAALTNMSKDASMTNSIKLVAGRLSGPDKYVDEAEAVGVPLYNMFIGNNMLWALITEHSCSVINELIAELRWEGSKPSFTLYKRIKPFLLNSPGIMDTNRFKNRAGEVAQSWSKSSPDDATGKKVQSSFFNVKKSDIPLEDIISIEMGNNWRDSANFVELMPDPSFISTGVQDNAVAKTLPGLKANSNDYDMRAWARDGFRPLMFNTKFFPTDSSKKIDLNGQVKWIPTIKKWYFDTHKMLNGTVTLMGQNQYIAVGDNIAIPSVAAGAAHYVARDSSGSAINKQTVILAHVEAISHTFTVQDNGARNFQTTVNFVRGVIANGTATALDDSNAYGIDNNFKSMPDSNRKHVNVTKVDK